MNKELEDELEQALNREMCKVRDRALASGMKTTCGVVLEMAQNKETNEADKLKSIIEFCERSLGILHDKDDQKK